MIDNSNNNDFEENNFFSFDNQEMSDWDNEDNVDEYGYEIKCREAETTKIKDGDSGNHDSSDNMNVMNDRNMKNLDQKNQNEKKISLLMMEERLKFGKTFTPSKIGDSIINIRKEFDKKFNKYIYSKYSLNYNNIPFYDRDIVQNILTYPEITQKIFKLINMSNQNELLELLTLYSHTLPFESSIRDEDGNTPLMAAVQKNSPEIFDLLWDWSGGHSYDNVVNYFGDHLRGMINRNPHFNYGYGKYANYFEYKHSLTTFLIGTKDHESSIYRNFIQHRSSCDQNNLLKSIFAFIRPEKKYKFFHHEDQNQDQEKQNDND
jgi:hypothetical protein